MFDGRHCTLTDLDLLILKTNQFRQLIKKNNGKDLSVIEKQINAYIDLINNFDGDIANKLKRQIYDNQNDYEKILMVIGENIDVLKKNVYVDIYEHQ